MDWLETLRDINYVAVLLAVVSSFAVGMIWYSPKVFGKKWMKETGLKQKDVEKKDGMASAMIHTGLASFISASVLAALLLGTVTIGALNSAIFGAWVGLGIAMMSMMTHDVFSKKSIVLTRINGFHDIVKFVVMGLIIGGIGL